MRINNYFKVLPLVLMMFTSCDKKEEEINLTPEIENQVFEVSESVSSDEKFADIVATDAEENKLVFKIKENEADLFQVSEEGALSLAASKSLDYETKTMHKITVEVSDGSTKALAEVTIKVTDVDETPVIANQQFTVVENVSATHIIGSVVATDPNNDPLTYNVTSTDFEITNSGDLSLIDGKTLDYETKNEYKITVQVSDGALTASAEITIKVTNENETPVIADQTFTVAEDVLATQIIGKVAASDPDVGARAIELAIKEDSDSLFKIHGNGDLYLKEGKELDYETKTTHKITVEVSDGTLTATAEITIKVTDVDENEAPVIENQEFTVAEDISGTAVIGKVVATDANNNTLSFSIKVNDKNIFQISNTGELKLTSNASLDYEINTEHKITVEVSDGTLTAAAEITINVTDVVEETIVNIPDANFKNALLANTTLNTNGDSEIQVSEAESYGGRSLNFSNNNIRDLTGIEAFTKITVLYISNNNFTNLDLSKNVNLETIHMYNCNLTGVDLSKNVKLRNLLIHNNSLTSLDLSKNVLLQQLMCFNNDLSSLDITKNIGLTRLRAYGNRLTEIDLTKNLVLEEVNLDSNNLTNINLSQNTKLKTFIAQRNSGLRVVDFSNNLMLEKLGLANNNMTSLDVSQNTKLRELYVSNNQLKTLNISNNTSLQTISCDDNALTSLNLSKHIMLTTLFLRNNKLTTINMANFNNHKIVNFNVTGNANLTCIQIDNDFTPTVRWIKDSTASYSFRACP